MIEYILEQNMLIGQHRNFEQNHYSSSLHMIGLDMSSSSLQDLTTEKFYIFVKNGWQNLVVIFKTEF